MTILDKEGAEFTKESRKVCRKKGKERIQVFCVKIEEKEQNLLPRTTLQNFARYLDLE